MKSKLTTLKKDYILETNKFICNKFGLAEFLAFNYDKMHIKGNIKVLDVGCGALPIGIFLADQYDNYVIGVELNSIACECAKKNIDMYGLEQKIEIINANFANYIEEYNKDEFDLIIANPPVDDNVPIELINRYAEYTYEWFNDESYSYLTNSWHSIDGKDLLDYIFEFGKKKLKINGYVVIVFCTIDCKSSEYVVNKAKKYGYDIADIIEGYIKPESVGAETVVNDNILTYVVKFKRSESNENLD